MMVIGRVRRRAATSDRIRPLRRRCSAPVVRPIPAGRPRQAIDDGAAGRRAAERSRSATTKSATSVIIRNGALPPMARSAHGAGGALAPPARIASEARRGSGGVSAAVRGLDRRRPISVVPVHGERSFRIP